MPWEYERNCPLSRFFPQNLQVTGCRNGGRIFERDSKLVVRASRRDEPHSLDALYEPCRMGFFANESNVGVRCSLGRRLDKDRGS
jgi:hypothetical protein